MQKTYTDNRISPWIDKIKQKRKDQFILRSLKGFK